MKKSRKKSKNSLAFSIFLNSLGFLSIALAIIMYYNPWVAKSLTYATINKNCITGLNASGAPMWTKCAKDVITKSLVTNLFNDERKHLLFSAGYALSMDQFKVSPLICLNKDGDTLWTYFCDLPPNYDGGIGDFSGKEFIRDFIVADFVKEKEGKEVLVLYWDYGGWYPAHLSLIDNQGHRISNYWHPGHIDKILAYPEKDGSSSIVFCGANNRLTGNKNNDSTFVGYHIVVGKLSSHFEGEAYPYSGKRKDKANEDWYYELLPFYNNVKKMFISDVNGDNIQDINVWTKAGFNIVFNSKGILLDTSIIDRKEVINVKYKMIINKYLDIYPSKKNINDQ